MRFLSSTSDFPVINNGKLASNVYNMPVRILWIENENIKWLLLEVEGSNGDEDV
jgi:hypothetical protein